MRRTRAEWFFLIEQQRSSGMTIAAYCRANGIIANAFYNARSRYGYCCTADQSNIPVMQNVCFPVSGTDHESAPCSTVKTQAITLEPIRVTDNLAVPLRQERNIGLPDDPLVFWINGIHFVIPSMISGQNLIRIVSACLKS